jgi:hypothetical protein
MDALKHATYGTGVPVGRSMQAGTKPAAKGKTDLWDSAFHAERGCLDGGLPLRYTTPFPHH